ncbi:MAG: RagB/SusD family nutrient uptake outer membrane protein [Ginsengibacter sp.]
MKLKNILIVSIALGGVFSCTKLEQKLNDSLTTTPGGGAADPALLLNSTYNSLNGVLHAQDLLFSLQETTSDEALVPTRGGDWDDNGAWRVLHEHKWTTIHSQFKNVYNALGAVESNALTTLAFSPSASQAAEAKFLLSLAQFYYLDLYGQVPYRAVDQYNAITAAPVYSPQEAIDNLTTTLTSIIPTLPAANVPYKASPDAARFLLMKVLLNKGAYLNRKSPTFADADMQQVISLGNQIIGGGYSLTPVYFDNFGPSNSTLSKERILAWPNSGASASNGINSGGINARWMMTLHYNSWDKNGSYGGAGWNGFSTVADFYNTFGATDMRVGGQPYPGVTSESGLKPGFLVGQQFNENGVAETDRHGNPLAFTPLVHLVETDKDLLEVAGIRVIKYPPDYTAYSGGNQHNQLQIFRFADVLLMVAEAKMRLAAPDAAAALILVNQLRTARGATPLATLTLVNPTNVADPNTLLAERGRELYWESWRRQDLIRYGVFLIKWQLKEADADPERNLLFPIAQDELLANPNLHQNPGYQ